jgi:CheY-like chemotaxis protein
MDQGLGELKVLLVDDNEHMRSIVGTILQGIGIVNLREARDGSEALEALRTWPADIAFVDFRMEPMDGVDLTRLVRNAADSRNPFLPIIMMTGFADRPRVEEARDSGVTELIVKPVTARAIIDRLNAELGKALQHPDVRERILGVGAEPAHTTPEAFGALIRSEIARWAKVIKAAGVKVDG